MTPPEFRRSVDSDDLAATVAAALIARIVERQAATGVMRLVMTGGRTAEAVVRQLLVAPGGSAIDWPNLQIWWSDERFVPLHDADRNDTQVGALFRVLPGQGPVLHPIPGPDEVSSPEEAAVVYTRTLPTVGWDLVLLSLGEDGHIASIFPESPALHVSAAVVAVHGAPKEPRIRVSLTPSTLNSASEVWILASGSAKAAAVRLSQQAGPLQMPARGVQGRNRTVWFVDDAAAERLPGSVGRRD